MGRPRRITDAEIAAAARACFTEHGPSVSTEVIAERLGVTAPALFKRVGSKENLLARALCPSDGVPEWLLALERGPEEGPCVDQLVGLLRNAWGFFRRIAPSLVVVRAAGVPLDRVFPADVPPPPIATRRAVAGWLRRAADQGRIRELDVEAVAEALLGTIEARSFLAYVAGDAFVAGDDDDVLERVVRALVQDEDGGGPWLIRCG